MIGKYGYDAITILAALGLWAALVLASILFVLVTGPIIIRTIQFFWGVIYGSSEDDSLSRRLRRLPALLGSRRGDYRGFYTYVRR